MRRNLLDDVLVGKRVHRLCAKERKERKEGKEGRKDWNKRINGYLEMAKMVNGNEIGLLKECTDWRSCKGHPPFSGNIAGPSRGKRDIFLKM